MINGELAWWAQSESKKVRQKKLTENERQKSEHSVEQMQEQVWKFDQLQNY